MLSLGTRLKSDDCDVISGLELPEKTDDTFATDEERKDVCFLRIKQGYQVKLKRC